MKEDDEFRIIIIDDSTDIHEDFIKILSSIKSSNKANVSLEELKTTLFEEDKKVSISLPQFIIDTASQGEEGFKRIEKAYKEGHPYALAFVDIRMPPGWDGVETIKHIWSVDKDIQIVICTAYSDYSWEETITELGKRDNLLILKKPFDHIAVRQLAYALTHKWKLLQQTKFYTAFLEENIQKRTASLQKSLSITRATLDSSADGMVVVDLKNKIIDFNNKFCEMWKIPLDLIAQKDFNLIIPYMSDQLEDKQSFAEEISVLEKNIDKSEFRLIKLEDKQTFEFFTQPYNLEDQIIGRVWSFHDITQRAQLEETLHHQATHDNLTGLGNRVYLENSLSEILTESQIQHKKFAVLFLDLDRFKLVNDSLSHAAGDKVLKTIATRLTTVIRKSDVLARLGGDEFVIVLDNISNEEEVCLIAQKIMRSMYKSFDIDNNSVLMTTSIGISVYPKDGTTINELLKNADAAMYHAKESGSNQFQFYSDKIQRDITQRFELEMELIRAIKNNEFVLYYQPQFDLKDNKLVAVEALVRWNHPDKGMILPLEFIPLAEEVELIIPIGDWVMRTACQQLKKWHNEGQPAIRVAVNVVNQQLRQMNFVESVKRILSETQLEPRFLELELTENVIINNPGIINKINSLKAIGVQIALDDFGSGYSTLNSLRDISLDRLKIDRSFVQNILINKGDEAIIQAIIDIAKSFNLEVLAEGVETKTQLQFLKDRKCGEVQGFYFSKPLSKDDMESLLHNRLNINEILN